MNFVNSSNGDAMVTKTTTKTLSWIKFQDRTLYDDGVLQYSVNEIYRGSNSYTCARTGYNNPNWRSIIKSGGDATTVLVGNNVQVRRAEPLLYTAGFVPNPKVGAKDSYTEIFVVSSQRPLKFLVWCPVLLYNPLTIKHFPALMRI